MPLYRGIKKGSSAPSAVEPTRRVARPEPKARPQPKSSQTAGPAKSAPEVAIARDPQLGPVVGWLAIIAGPGRGEVLPLNYGVNDIGRGAGVRVRLNYGDAMIGADNQAAIIYTARARRFYLQSVAAETWLNGRLVRSSEELTGGEVLQLGQTRLRFVPLCGPDFDWRDND